MPTSQRSPAAGESTTSADVGVVIVNYRTPDLTKRCLAALRLEKEHLPHLCAVVVDGGSGDNSAQELAQYVRGEEYRSWVSFLPLSLNGGFGWANNQAMLNLSRRKNAPEFIYLLNPDAEVSEGAVSSLLKELLRRPSCGAVGSQLLTLDGKHAASAFRFPSAGREFVGSARSEVLGRLFRIGSTVVSAAETEDVDWVTGASVMFRTQALRETGLFDDGFFLYFEEVELMHRLREHGWCVRHVPASKVRHVEGASTGLGAASVVRSMPDYWYHSRRRYFARVGGRRTVLLANISIILGHTVASLKRLGRATKAGSPTSIRDIVRFGLRATQPDMSASVPRWGDDPGKPPAWMANK